MKGLKADTSKTSMSNVCLVLELEGSFLHLAGAASCPDRGMKLWLIYPAYAKNKNLSTGPDFRFPMLYTIVSIIWKTNCLKNNWSNKGKQRKMMVKLFKQMTFDSIIWLK